MKLFKKIISILVIFFAFQANLIADVPYYLDFKYILNQSDAGKKAQVSLKNKLDSGIKKLQVKEKEIQEEEKQIIKQKKVVSAEEYKKKVSQLRNKVSTLQKERSSLLKTVADERSKMRSELLKHLNPIIKEFMKEKNIRMVIDKKSMLLADENLDITKDIIKKLNAKLKTIKLN
tara:strand:+ start:3938 stop:4462 length:525 start_codon:yes stop_codon:yes gene_type:complete